MNHSNNTISVVYHSNCADGFGAAWAMRKFFQEQNISNYQFVKGLYNDPKFDPQDYEGHEVYFVDFSAPEDVILELADLAKKVVILDHHKSAQEKLQHLIDEGVIFGEFDMNRSGCQIVWDTLFPGKRPPKAFSNIADRDLWKFELPYTEEVSAAIFSYDYDFDVWDELMNDDNYERLIQEGSALNRKLHKDINEMIDSHFVETVPCNGGYVFLVNVPYLYSSSFCNKLLKDLRDELSPEKLAIAWWKTNKGYHLSIRSDDQGWDAAKFAETLGGGGHRNASGAKVESLEVLYNSLMKFGGS